MKSIEKIPKGKQVFLYIDYQNSFFSHPWWGKQIVSLLQEKEIQYTFICKHPKARKYFDEHNIPYQYDAPNRILYAMHLFGMLLFNAKKFHLSVFTKRSSLSYLFIIGEVIGIGAIIYVMYQFLVPSATILVQPAYTVEDVVYNYRFYPSGFTGFINSYTWDTNYITVPFHMGAITHKRTVSVPLESIQFLSNPSKWTVEVFNTLSTPFTLRQYTRFTTANGLLFTADEWFVLPAWSRQRPSRTVVKLTAVDKDDAGLLIWDKGNIASGTRLLIKNLNQSAILWAVYANAVADFQWWITKKEGVVTDWDLEMVKQKLLSTVTWENKKLIVKQEFNDPDWLLLPMTDMITLWAPQFTFNVSSGDVAETIEWTISVQLNYPYVIRWNLMQGVQEYVKQRPSQISEVISLQRNTTTFYDTYTIGEYIIVPTKVSVVRWYNFDRDSNWVKSDIKQKLVGLSLEEANKTLLTYPEISSVVIKNSPRRSQTLPTLKSRIHIKTTSPE